MTPRSAVAVLIQFIVALSVLAGPAAAVEIEFNGGPVRREILAIYDSRHEPNPQGTRIHQFAEMPLNWLGLSVTYADVNAQLPPLEQMAKYRGIVTWLIEPLDRPERYLNWLDQVTAQGIRLAIFAEVSPGYVGRADGPGARVLARLGLTATTDYISVTHRWKVSVTTPDMVGFERPVDKALPDFRVIHASDPRTVIHLAANDQSNPVSTPAVLIATGPAGGYVADDFSTVFDQNTDRVRWMLNPFLFLKLALVRERMPAPDVTTLSGRRIYFSHIDGDGWNNVSQIDGYRQAQTLSADVIRKEAIEAYPDLPVTIGVIGGDLRPELGGNAAGQAAARRLYALPHVEVASHTYTHPFDWGFFESYSRTQEEAMIDKVRAPERSAFQRVRQMLYTVAGSPVPVDRAGRYVAGSSDLPRTYLTEPFDIKKEVFGGLAAAEEMAPAGKKAKILLWSGNCLPFEGAIKATRDAGVRNMNGGDSRLDAEFPSVFYVPPISKPVGKQRQIYSGNSNENTYTNDWTGPYYGFSLLGETVRNTETPRRLKPFNIYYHMYSGEREAALAAVKQNLNLARSASLVPVAASHYAAIADDFFSVTLSQVDALSWNVRDRGELQTVRFDDADALAVDTQKSRGVLGSTRHPSGALYVALDPAVEAAQVVLRPLSADRSTQPAEPAGAEPVQLVSSRWWFSDFRAAGCGFGVTAQGYGPGEMTWQARPGQSYTITAERDGRQVDSRIAVADGSGALQVTVAADAIAGLSLWFACNG
jgi:polysaccharide biosynthesis protein PelA